MTRRGSEIETNVEKGRERERERKREREREIRCCSLWCAQRRLRRYFSRNKRYKNICFFFLFCFVFVYISLVASFFASPSLLTCLTRAYICTTGPGRVAGWNGLAGRSGDGGGLGREKGKDTRVQFHARTGSLRPLPVAEGKK